MISCENCGKKNPNGYNFCEDCYTPLFHEKKEDTQLDGKGNDFFNLPAGYLFAKRYKIFTRIGRSGGFGTTYRVKDTKNNETVSLKLFRRKYINKKAVYKRLEERFDSLRELSNPSIANVLDYGISSKVFYAVFEYVEGDDLKRHLIRQGEPLPNKELALIFYKTAEALDFLHSNGITHGDISPFNIIYNQKRKNIVLIDVGIKDILAEESRGLLKNDFALGLSLFYMAPEVINNLAPAPLSDLYSLGAVMYEIACDYLPFKSHSSYRLVTYIINEIPDRPTLLNPDLPLFLGEPIMKLLSKNPIDRFHSAGELMEELQKGAKKRTLGTAFWFIALLFESFLVLYVLYLLIR